MKAAVILLTVAAVVTGGIPLEKPQLINDRLESVNNSGGAKFTAEIRVSTFYITRHACNGALIGPEWVLTPAQYVRDAPWYNSFQVVVGESEVLPVKDVIVHEKAQGVTNDIALLRLASPVKYSDTIQPVNLPFSNAHHSGSATLYKWKSYGKFQSSSMILNRALACTHIQPNIEEIICAGDSTVSAIKGDEGSPLTVSDGLQGQVLIGLLSFAMPEPAPAIFTRISLQTNWILSKLMEA